MNFRKVSLVSITSLLLVAHVTRADVKTEERTKIQFAGALGGFMKVFGGKSAKEGLVSKVAVKGNRKMTTNDETAELVDLTEEKVYRIDLKKKSYTVLTFAQMRQQMEDEMAKAKAQAASQPSAPKQDPKAQTASKPEFVMDFKLQESGQKKTINGYDCHEVVATITMRPKDKSSQDGSMVLTSNMWMTSRIAAIKELDDFDRRFAQKLALPFDKDTLEDMRPAMATYPGLGDAMGKMEIEKVKMDGTAILTVIGFAAVADPNQPNPQADAKTPSTPQRQQQPSVSGAIGGLLGGLRGKSAAKDANAESANSNNPGSIMTTNHELVSVSTSVAETDISIPAGFKEKK